MGHIAYICVYSMISIMFYMCYYPRTHAHSLTGIYGS